MRNRMRNKKIVSRNKTHVFRMKVDDFWIFLNQNKRKYQLYKDDLLFFENGKLRMMKINGNYIGRIISLNEERWFFSFAGSLSQYDNGSCRDICDDITLSYQREQKLKELGI